MAQIDSNVQQSTYITLISSDNFHFHLPRTLAMRSNHLKRTFDPSSPFSEARTGICRFENISGVVLEKVVEYFFYAAKNDGVQGVGDMFVPSEICLELLIAADYLDT